MKIKFRLSSRHSDLVVSQLKSYSALAGSFLLYSGVAHSAVEYTDVDPDLQILSSGGVFFLDLNNDSVNDFQFNFSFFSFPQLDLTSLELRAQGQVAGNEIVGSFNDLSALESSAIIDANQNFINYGVMAKENGTMSGTSAQGMWVGARFRSLGLRINVSGQTHYGWARLSILPPSLPAGSAQIFLHDYAWETTPNGSIATPLLPSCEAPNGIAITNLRFQSLKINWDIVPTAERYQIRGREVAGAPTYAIFTIEDIFQTSKSFSALQPGRDYEISMRTICLDNADTSQWSAPIFVHTFDCIAPDSVFTSNLTPTSVQLNWVPQTTGGSPIRHVISGRPLGSSSIETKFTFSTATNFQVQNLTPGITYEWAVRLHCQNNVYSPFSPVDLFTTPLVSSKQNAEDVEESSPEILIRPHPVVGSSIISFPNDGTPYQMAIHDMTGKVVRLINDIRTSEVLLEKGHLAAGLYVMELRGKKHFTRKLLIQ